MKRYFLGIDIGTFESRGILIEASEWRRMPRCPMG